MVLETTVKRVMERTAYFNHNLLKRMFVLQ